MPQFNNHKVGSSFTRLGSIHGGSLIILNNQLKFKERKDILSLSVERTIELSAVELEQFIVVCVYRPPLSNFELFENIMESVLLKISHSRKKLLICGDFNVNILENSTMSVRLLNLFKSGNLNYIFMEPTRVTATSATCIDNIFTDIFPTNKSVISKLESDHLGQLIVFETLRKNVVKKQITFVPVTTGRVERMKQSLAQALPFLSSDMSPNNMYNSFFHTFMVLYKAIFTSKSVVVSGAPVFSEWATTELHKRRQALYALYEERRFNTSDEFKEHVKQYSKQFKIDCHVAKRNYLSQKIKNSSNIIKTTWKVINMETGRSKNTPNDLKLKIDGRIVDSSLEVATEFETFFTEIPVSTTMYLNSSPSSAVTLLEENAPECNINLHFEHVSSSDVLKAFKSINVKKTNDLWGVSVHVLKSLVEIIAPELAVIFNNSVDCGEFPDLMKHSKITPLFKSGSTSDPTNFRPISVLPTFSKIFEKIVLSQLLKHFNINNLMHNMQFGFTRGRSTTDAGVELVKHIFDAWEESRDALGIFCDLSKAFDCVCHETLIRKLEYYGVRGSALNLLKSYLHGRIQRVEVNGQRSPGSLVSMGVPQGSILGPFLFLIYINDLPYLVKTHNDIVLFADDTSLIFKLIRQQQACNDVNNAISKVVNWFNVNNLLLNEKKTKCIKFVTNHVKHEQASVIVKGEELELVDSTVFLGIMLDSKLQWGPHIANLSNRLSSAAFAVSKIRHLTDVNTARLVYFSYFHSIMSYGILLWGSASEIHTIFVLQKRAIRAIYKLNHRYSLRDKFKEINIMTLHCQYIYDNIVYVHKNIVNFRKNCDVHNINTRNKHKLVVPTTRLQKIKKSFMGNCVRFYNKLPGNVTEMSINKFKNHVKRKLISKAYYGTQDYMNDKAAWD